jgi:hypothetical protein
MVTRLFLDLNWWLFFQPDVLQSNMFNISLNAHFCQNLPYGQGDFLLKEIVDNRTDKTQCLTDEGHRAISPLSTIGSSELTKDALFFSSIKQRCG